VADVADLEDETAGCCVQLTRDENHDLPFRIVGPFHVDEGMHNRMLLEDAKSYLHVITIANHARRAAGAPRHGRFVPPEGSDDASSGSDTSDRTSQKRAAPTSFFGRWLAGGDAPSRGASEEDKPFVSAREWIGVPS